MSQSAEPGTYFIDRYRVVDEIGVGGMASVHLARMDGLGGFQRWAAIKKIHPHLIEDESFILMFLDEARVAARISHPNVAMVFDVGKDHDTYWIAMEYLHGEPLREIMRRSEELGQPIPPEIACKVVADAAEGLHAAHELLGKNGEKLGLVHRDVTPHNIFVTYDGVSKVLDFGIAKFSSRLAQATQAATLKGKLAYMSPEQVQGETVDRRTDIFALGVVLWELTTGQRLFRMDNDLDTLAKVQECNVPRPSTIVRGYPMDLEKVVLKALVKNRGERYRTAREFSRALQSFFLRRGLFIGSDEVSSFMTATFKDRLEKRDAHLRWAAEVTQTVNVEELRARALAPQPNSSTPARPDDRQRPLPAAGRPIAPSGAQMAARPSAMPPGRAAPPAPRPLGGSGAGAAKEPPRPLTSRVPTEFGLGSPLAGRQMPAPRGSQPQFGQQHDLDGPSDDAPTMAVALSSISGPNSAHLQGAMPPPEEEAGEDSTIVDDAVDWGADSGAKLPDLAFPNPAPAAGMPPMARTMQMQEQPGFLQRAPSGSVPAFGMPPQNAMQPASQSGGFQASGAQPMAPNPFGADPFAQPQGAPQGPPNRGMMTMPRISSPLGPADYGRTVTAQAVTRRRSKWLILSVAAAAAALVAAVVLFVAFRHSGSGATAIGKEPNGPLSAARLAFAAVLEDTASAAPVMPSPVAVPEEPAAVEPTPAPVIPPPVEPTPAEPAAKPAKEPAAAANHGATAKPKEPTPVAEKPTAIKGMGTLTIVCLPKCKEIYDNGVNLGPGPITNRTVPAGNHTIRFIGVDDKKKTFGVKVPVDGHADARQFVSQ